MQGNKAKTIDIDLIMADKMGGKARYVPRFAVEWLKKIVHEDQVNDFLWENRGVTGVEWLERCVDYLGMKLTIEGEENLPPADDGKLYTFVSNHPLGGIDGVALGAVIGRKYGGRFRYLVNDLLMNLPGLAPLCIPINKTGGQSRAFPAMVEAGFKGNNHILMFPAGLCSRKRGGEIRDLEWKKTFVVKSVETQRDIVPIHFGGRNSAKFYAIANACKALGLKFNAAMLFLVDEMYKNTGKEFAIKVGRPIPWQGLGKEKTPQQWAQHIKEGVYKL